MVKKLTLTLAALLALVTSASADWSLADHLRQVLVYPPAERVRLKWDGTRYRFGGYLLMRCTWMAKGKLAEYKEGMRVGGKSKVGQVLLSGSQHSPIMAEFRVRGGSHIDFDYGMADLAFKRKAPPAKITVTIEADGKTTEKTFRIAKNTWRSLRVSFPSATDARVLLKSERMGLGGYHWAMMVVRGDGTIAPLADTEAKSPVLAGLSSVAKPMSESALPKLRPSPWRVTRRPDADILFYKGTPFLSFACKGNRSGYQHLEIACGFNTCYQEGRAFGPHWPKGAPTPVFTAKDTIYRDLAACQKFGIPFKSAMSLAHCTPFMPPWLVKKEDLGYVGHKMRHGGPTHASIFRAKTLEYYLKGLEGWVKPMKDQPVIYVFSQEDVPSHLDDQSAEAKALWRAWLRKRFKADFAAFSKYVGGVRGVTSFDAAPYPKRYDPPRVVGYGRRLSWLKLVWVVETFGDFLEKVFARARELSPGTPLTQRYVYSPWGVYLSRRVKSDYNYTFGHLTTEALPNNNGVGRKAWTAAYAHVGVLPLPRGGSIGKCWDRVIRRGDCTEAELRTNIYTLLANGASGFEYQPFFTVWGKKWRSAGLYRIDGKPTKLGVIAAKVIKRAHVLSRNMVHYEALPDVAVFHDAAACSGPFSGGWNQSKAGVYTLTRECGYHPDPLTLWDMTDRGLRGKKALVLAGTTSMAPEIIGAVRRYVRGGGTLVAFHDAQGGGFPGCNSYDYSCPVREGPRSVCFKRGGEHLGDVLGVLAAGKAGTARSVRVGTGDVDLAPVNKLIAEKKWMKSPVCLKGTRLARDAKVFQTFGDGSPAAWRRAVGKGQVVVFAYDLPCIANNLTVPRLYKPWDAMMKRLGCRKALDTGDYYVEAGVWRDDAGKRTVFLINHDAEKPRAARLPDGSVVRLAAGESTSRILGR